MSKPVGARGIASLPVVRSRLQTRAAAALRRLGRQKLETAAVAGIVAAAAALRLYDLESLPAGLHGDEAIFGLEGERVLREGWIGLYSPTALGQPTGPFYVSAASVALLGNTILAVRLVSVLVGIAAVVALYVVLRANFDWLTGAVGALLLALMSWHVHFSRVAFPLAAWPLVVIVATGVLMKAQRSAGWAWWGAAGALAAVGIYVYNGHVLFLAAAALIVAGDLVLDFGSARKRAAAFAAAAVVVALPMIAFALTSNSGHFDHARQVSLFRSEEWKAVPPGVERLELLGERYFEYWQGLCCDPVVDGVDATGVTPIVPPALLVLSAIGAGFALWRRRSSLAVFGAVVALVMPLAAVATVDGSARRTLALAPFLAAFAAIAVVALARVVGGPVGALRARVAAAVVVGGLLGGAVAGVTDYFDEFRRSDMQRWVFAEEMTDAALFVRDLPPGTRVYFYSDRWSFDYETRQFLAPEIDGVDRSAEFGTPGFAVEPDVREPTFVLLGTYRQRLPEIRGMYPEGVVTVGGAPGSPTFVAYRPRVGSSG